MESLNRSTERSKRFYKKLEESGGKRLIVNLPSNAVIAMNQIMELMSFNQTEAIRFALLFASENCKEPKTLRASAYKAASPKGLRP